MVDHKGPNALEPGEKRPFVVLNVYKYAWKRNPSKVPSVRTVYFDEIRIGDSRSNLVEVSPRNKVLTPDTSLEPEPPAGLIVLPDESAP